MRLRGPRDILMTRPATQAALLALGKAVRNGAAPPPEVDVYARVDYGRWVADCPCRAGCAVHPEWSKTVCLDCGRVLRVIVPEDYVQIEDALLERSTDDQRQWAPGLSVAEVRDETMRLATAHAARRQRERER
jgi:hypothetical protein